MHHNASPPFNIFFLPSQHSFDARAGAAVSAFCFDYRTAMRRTPRIYFGHCRLLSAWQIILFLGPMMISHASHYDNFSRAQYLHLRFGLPRRLCHDIDMMLFYLPRARHFTLFQLKLDICQRPYLCMGSDAAARRRLDSRHESHFAQKERRRNAGMNSRYRLKHAIHYGHFFI